MPDPGDIPGLECWLKADSLALSDNDPVTTWEDSHTSNKDATGGSPLYKTNVVNGLPVVRFDGVDDAFTVALTNNDSTRTLFALVKNATTDNGEGVVGWGANGRIASNGTDQDYQISSEAGNQTFTGSTGSNAVLLVAAWQSASVGNLYVNGDGVTAWDPHDGWMNGVDATLELGNTGGIFWSGDFCEFLLYDTALSDAAVDSVRGYFDSKWGLGFWPPLGMDDAQETLRVVRSGLRFG